LRHEDLSVWNTVGTFFEQAYFYRCVWHNVEVG
jgi:hypothetical protein